MIIKINKQEVLDYVAQENVGDKLLTLDKLRDYLTDTFQVHKYYGTKFINEMCKDKLLIRSGTRINPCIKILKKK